MEEITRNDFSFFQNEILKDIKALENKVNEKISSISKTFQNTALIIEQKYENAKVRMDEIIQKLETENLIGKIDDRLSKFSTKIEEMTVVTNTKLASFHKDLSNACFKYDKIFLNNISSPGLIGDGCPYPTMKAFLEFMNNKMKEMISSKEKNAIDFKRYTEWVKSTLDQFKSEINENKNSNYEFLVKEMKQYDKKTTEKINAVEDRLSFIKIENGRYNYNLNRKWEELEEKLKLFYTMNDNLINVYNNNRKEFLQVKTKFNDLSDYLKDLKYNKNNLNVKCLFDDLSKKIKINIKKQKTDTEPIKLNILPSIGEISKINLNKKYNNTEQNFNIEKPKGRLLKKKTLQIDSFGSSFNSNRKINSNSLFGSNRSNFNLIGDNSNKPRNVKFSFERKNTQNLDFSKNNIKAFNNNFASEEKREIEKEQKTIIKKQTFREISYNKIIDNIEEQNKENSSRNNSLENNKDNKEEKEKEKEKEKEAPDNISNSKGIIKEKEKVKENETIEDIDVDIQSNSNKSNADINEQKSKSQEKNNTNNINNSSPNLLLYDNKNYINNFNNSKYDQKLDLDDELIKVNEKFDKLYDKMNNKILEINTQINKLIGTINKLIFRKDANIKKIKEIDFFVERKKKNIFLDNSGICLPYSNNKSSDDNKSVKKDNNERDNSFNFINKKSRNPYKGKLLFNNISNNRSKIVDSRTNSNDIVNAIKDGHKCNNYYIRMIDPLSINKIETYLIKKFTESN